MKYVVLNLHETIHGGPIKVVGSLDESGLAKLEANPEYEVDRTQGGWDKEAKTGIVWLEEGGFIVAVPTENLSDALGAL